MNNIMDSSTHTSSEMDFSSDEKLAIISILTQIIEADTIIDPRETSYMDAIMAYLGICVNDLDHLETYDIDLSATTLLAMTPYKQCKVKQWFHTMAAADGYVDSRETEVTERIFTPGKWYH